MAAVNADEVLLMWRALRQFRSGRRAGCAPRGRPRRSQCPLFDACPRWRGQPDDYHSALDEPVQATEARRATWPCTRIMELLGPDLHRLS